MSVVQFGNLQIQPGQPSGNSVEISVAPDQSIVVVTNGTTETFPAGQVYNITYTGSAGGGDNFENNTPLVLMAHASGGNNKLVGGTTYSYVFFYGDNNTFDGTAGLYTDMFVNGGQGDTLTGAGRTI